MKKIILPALLFTSIFLTSCSGGITEIPKPFTTPTQDSTVSSSQNNSQSESKKELKPSYGGVKISDDWSTPSVATYSPGQVSAALDMLKLYSQDAFANEEFLTGSYRDEPQIFSRTLNPYFSQQLKDYISGLDMKSTNPSVVRDTNVLATLLNNDDNFVISKRGPVRLNLSDLAAAPEPSIKALKVYFVANESIPLKSSDSDDIIITVRHNVSVWVVPDKNSKNGWVIAGHYADWSQSNPTKEKS